MTLINPAVTGVLAKGQIPFTHLERHVSGPKVVVGSNDFWVDEDTTTIPRVRLGFHDILPQARLHLGSDDDTFTALGVNITEPGRTVELHGPDEGSVVGIRNTNPEGLGHISMEDSGGVVRVTIGYNQVAETAFIGRREGTDLEFHYLPTGGGSAVQDGVIDGTTGLFSWSHAVDITGVLDVHAGIDMNSTRVSNLADPASAQDAVTLSYLNTTVASMITGSLTAGKMPYATGTHTIGDTALTYSAGKITGLTQGDATGEALHAGRAVNGTAGRIVGGGALTGDLTLDLATAGTAGTYTLATITTDAYGRVTSASSSSGGVISGLTATRIPIASSGTALTDDSALTFDTTNHRLLVGSGTTTGRTFNVSQSVTGAALVGIRNTHASGFSTIVFEDNSGNQKIAIGHDNTGGSYLQLASQETLSFFRSDSGGTTRTLGQVVYDATFSDGAGSGKFFWGTTNSTGKFFEVTPPVCASPAAAPTIFRAAGAAHTSLPASTNTSFFQVQLGQTVEWATGTMSSLQLRGLDLLRYTIAFVGDSTTTNSTMVYINGAPAAGAHATNTTPIALFVDGGTTRLDGNFLQGSDGSTSIAFFGAALATQQAIAAFTNNITAGGTTDSPANWTDLATYANDAAAIRNCCYQLCRKVNQLTGAGRTYGLYS